MAAIKALSVYYLGLIRLTSLVKASLSRPYKALKGLALEGLKLRNTKQAIQSDATLLLGIVFYKLWGAVRKGEEGWLEGV